MNPSPCNNVPIRSILHFISESANNQNDEAINFLNNTYFQGDKPTNSKWKILEETTRMPKKREERKALPASRSNLHICVVYWQALLTRRKFCQVHFHPASWKDACNTINQRGIQNKNPGWTGIHGLFGRIASRFRSACVIWCYVGSGLEKIRRSLWQANKPSQAYQDRKTLIDQLRANK